MFFAGRLWNSIPLPDTNVYRQWFSFRNGPVSIQLMHVIRAHSGNIGHWFLMFGVFPCIFNYRSWKNFRFRVIIVFVSIHLVDSSISSLNSLATPPEITRIIALLTLPLTRLKYSCAFFRVLTMVVPFRSFLVRLVNAQIVTQVKLLFLILQRSYSNGANVTIQGSFMCALPINFPFYPFLWV